MSSSTRSKILVFVIAVLLIANIAILIFFKGSANDAKTPAPADKPRVGLTVLVKEQIGFSPEQVTTFEQYKAKHKENIKPLFDSLKIAKTHFYALLNEKPSSDSIMIVSNNSANIGKWQSQIDLAFFTYFHKVRNLCTAEQKTKFDSLFPGFLEKMITPPYIRNTKPANPNEPAKKN